MMFASACEIVVISSLAAGGILMSQLPVSVIPMLLATTLMFTLGLDSIKLAVRARLRID